MVTTCAILYARLEQKDDERSILKSARVGDADIAQSTFEHPCQRGVILWFPEESLRFRENTLKSRGGKDANKLSTEDNK